MLRCDFFEAELFDCLLIAFVTVGIRGDFRRPVDEAYLFTAFFGKMFYSAVADIHIVNNDAADMRVGLADDLNDGHLHADIAYDAFVRAGGGDDHTVHEAVAQTDQAFFFDGLIVSRIDDHGGESVLSGFLLDTRDDLRKDGEGELRDHDSDHVELAPAQAAGQDVGAVAEFFHGSHDARTGVGVDIG